MVYLGWVLLDDEEDESFQMANARTHVNLTIIYQTLGNLKMKTNNFNVHGRISKMVVIVG